MKPPRSAVFAPLMVSLFLLAPRDFVFEVIAYVFMFATIFSLVLECVRPKVQLRKKAPPKPEIRLDINGPSN